VEYLSVEYICDHCVAVGSKQKSVTYNQEGLVHKQVDVVATSIFKIMVEF
jgi:hypothetical protein